MYSFIFGISRSTKRVISLFIDIILLISSFFLAYWTRLGGIVAFDNTEIWMTLLCTILITLFTFIKLGLYRAVLRYISFKALAMVAGGLLFQLLALFSFLSSSVRIYLELFLLFIFLMYSCYVVVQGC